MSPASPLVELVDVVKRFEAVDGQAGGGAEVLRGVDLEVQAGESIAIVGPSGSGKSTLLNVVGALLRPTSGRALVEGVDLASLGDDELARLRNERVGFVFQAHHLLPQCTALENVLVPTLVRRDKPDHASLERRANELLRRVGLGERAGHRPAQLSGGECQRVAVVRALINGPRLLLADEPTGSLDAEAAGEIGELLVEMHRAESLALVVVTHSDALAARMQRVLELRGGKLASRKSVS